MTTLRDLIPTKLAAGIWNCLAKHKQSIENFPQTETCELLILDRSIDQVYNICLHLMRLIFVSFINRNCIHLLMELMLPPLQVLYD